MTEKRPLLKGRGLLMIGGGIGLVIGTVVILLVLNGRPPDERPPAAVIAIAWVVGVVLAAGGMLIGLLIARWLVGDRIEVALRERDGGWRHGRLDVTPGHLSFQPYLWQVRIPRGKPIEFEVHHVGADTGRRPPAREMWSVNPLVRILDLETDKGDREVGVPKHQVEELRKRLGEPSRTA